MQNNCNKCCRLECQFEHCCPHSCIRYDENGEEISTVCSVKCNGYEKMKAKVTDND